MTADEITRALRCSRPGCCCARRHGNVHNQGDDETPSLSGPRRRSRTPARREAGGAR